MATHPVREWFVRSLVGRFPPIRFAFAYGSAVFQQSNRPKGKMLDMVFAVDDATSWHAENLRRNKSHYSFLRYLGPDAVTRVQRLSAGVYYNTLLHMDSQLLKYGVTTVDDLCQDLMDWKWLYISGRLQKPVVILTPLNPEDAGEEEERIATALRYNLRCAALCGVLQQGEEFTDVELFTTIANLSYRGDFRSVFGEDKRKVDNIVSGNLAEFQKLYQPYLQDLVIAAQHGKLKRHPSVTLQRYQDQLPMCLHHRLQQNTSLHQALRGLVLKSSIQQSTKGVLTAGLKKSVLYSWDKLRKMTHSLYKH